MNLQLAIDIAVLEYRLVAFEFIGTDYNLLQTAQDHKGCALMKPARDSTFITVWPPSKCTDHLDQGQFVILPTCLLPPQLGDCAG